MPLKPGDAVDAARTIIDGPRQYEQRRLQTLHNALKPGGVRVTIPDGTPPQMRLLAEKASTNYLPLIVDSLVQTMFVDGYRPARSVDNAAPWGIWQKNKLDARQTGVHRTTLKYGFAYATVLPGDPVPAIRGVSPRKLTAVYADPDEDDWPILALRVDDGMLRLYDEEAVYYLAVPRGPVTTGITPTFVETREHGLGVCPIVRFRDRMLLEGEEQLGVVEPVLAIQARVDETVFGLLVAQYYQAFKQRYVVGWLPENEADTLKAKASELWTFADPDVKVGQLDQAELNPILESKDSAVKDMAAVSQVPPQQLAVGAISNLSAEALAAMEAGKDRKVSEIETSLGESWEQTLQLAALAAGDDAGAGDDSAQVRWRDATARSLAQTVDALGKMVQMLGVPQQAVWERIPGVTQQDLEAWKQLASEADAIGGLTRLLDQQTLPAA